MRAWRSDGADTPRRLVSLHPDDGGRDLEETPSVGYCYVDPDGALYELTADGTLRREIAGPVPLTEVRDASGEACVYNREGRLLTTLGADERLTESADGVACIVQADGSTQPFQEVAPDVSGDVLPDVLPNAPPLQILPGFSDYLNTTASGRAPLTRDQQLSLAAALGDIAPRGVDALAFISLPDGTTLLQNTDGDIVGQLTPQASGGVCLVGLDGVAHFIEPGGQSLGQQDHDQMLAQSEQARAGQAATALGLMNAIIGLQNWEQMSELQRIAAVGSIYNVVDQLNGGALPADLGTGVSVLGLLNALDQGNIGGALYSGLALVESLTTTVNAAGQVIGAGLVTRTFGGDFLPAVGLVLALHSGDPIAIVSSALAFCGPWGVAAGVALTLLSSLVRNEDIPTREGQAHAQWDAAGRLQIVTDHDAEGGGATAAGWMQGMTSGLQSRLEGTGYALVPGLLPAIGYRYDPDGGNLAHSAPGFVYLAWVDAQGQTQTRYYDGQGLRNDGSGETLAGDFMVHAAAAIAPDWVVATALAHWQQTGEPPRLPATALPAITADGLQQIIAAVTIGVLRPARSALVDIDADGYLERTDWLAQDQAVLAIDADADGRIGADELVQLHGNARNDLDWLDANGDGVLDARDPAFAALRVWVDANGDGDSRTETRTLAEAGIVAIDFSGATPSVLHADGNREAMSAQRLIGDVLGVRYRQVTGGVLQASELADGSASLLLAATNTHAFDGQAGHEHAGRNVESPEGAEASIDGGDVRLVTTSARTAANSSRQTTTVVGPGDSRVLAGAAGTVQSGQPVGQTLPSAAAAVRGVVPTIAFVPTAATAAASAAAALREITAAMVRSAERGTLVGEGGLSVLGVVSAGMAAVWPSLVDAGPAMPPASSDADISPIVFPVMQPVVPVTPSASPPQGVDAESRFTPPVSTTEAGAQTVVTRTASITIERVWSDGLVPEPALAIDKAIDIAVPADGLPVRFTAPFSPFSSLPTAVTDDHADHVDNPTAPRPSPPGLLCIAPSLTADAATSTEDTELRFSADWLLSNDRSINSTAPGQTPLTLTSVSAPLHGSVSLQPDASGGLQVVFLPEANYHGPASFTYTAVDALGLASSATVILQIAPVNDAPVTRDESATGHEDQVLQFSAADLLANDSDPDSALDGDLLRITRVGAAEHGQVFLQADGTVRFEPDADYHGPAVFSYWVADRTSAELAQGEGCETQATVHLTVLAVNDLPVVTGESIDSDEDVALRIAPALLLANDGDIDIASDGQVLSIVAVGDAQHGEARLLPDGTIVFTPEPDYFGAASFVYTVSDGAGGEVQATAVVNLAPVNDAPLVRGETIAFDEDQVLSLDAALLLANDGDVDNPHDALTIVAVDNAVHGQVRLEPSGAIVFTPDADYFGAAAFRYTVSDGAGGFTVGQATLDIAPVNDAPRLLGEQVTLDEDEIVRWSSSALLANDDDIDNDHADLTIVEAGNATHGSVRLVGREIVFTPEPNYHGQAGFTYTVSDGAGGTTQARVDLSFQPVNDAPVVNDELLWGKSGVTYTLSAAALLANDSDVDSEVDGDTLAIVAVQAASHGAVSLLPDGSVRFTPEPGYTGRGSFEYVVEDTAGARTVGVAQIDFSRLNVAPVATDDSFIGYEDVPFSISSAQLLSNDHDSDNAASQLRVVGVDSATHGVASLDAQGNVLFVPEANYFGPASFNYRVADGEGGEASATAVLSLAAVNDAPVIEDIWYGRPLYGYRQVTLQLHDEEGIAYTRPGLELVRDEATAWALVRAGELRDERDQVIQPAVYRNGHMRPTGFDFQDATQPGESNGVAANDRPSGYAPTGTLFNDVYRQNGAVIAYDPDGDSAQITIGIATTPQHGHAWANQYVPAEPAGALDYTEEPALARAEPGAWQYFTTIGDLYTGADPFAIRVTDGEGASTVVSIPTSHSGAQRGGQGKMGLATAEDDMALAQLSTVSEVSQISQVSQLLPHEAGPADLAAAAAAQAAGADLAQAQVARIALVFNQMLCAMPPTELLGFVPHAENDPMQASEAFMQSLVHAATATADWFYRDAA